MKLKLTKYNIFLVLFFLYFIPRYFEYTTYTQIDSFAKGIVILKSISYVLSIIYWIMLQFSNKIKIRYLILEIVILGYFSYEAFIKNRNTIFVVILFALIFPIGYYEDYLKKVLNVSIILYIFTLVSCSMGIIQNVNGQGQKFGDEVVRFGMGFTYSGQMVMMLIPIVFLYFYVRKKNATLLEGIVWLVINGIVFNYCKTIMGAVLITIYIILFFLLKLIHKKNLLKKSIFVRFSPIIFLLTTLIILYLRRIGSVFALVVDAICSYRFNVGNIMIDTYGVKLFGTRFTDNTDYYYEILDSEYVHMLVGEGIVYLIIAIIISCVLMWFLQTKKDTNLILIFTLIFLNGIVNNGIFNLVMNPFIIIINEAFIEFISKNRNKNLIVIKSEK